MGEGRKKGLDKENNELKHRGKYVSKIHKRVYKIVIFSSLISLSKYLEKMR